MAGADLVWRAPRCGGALHPFLVAALFAIFLVHAPSAQAFSKLQSMIDATPPGGILQPPPGIYEGGVVIRKPMTLDGRGQVTIDAGGRGTVIKVKTHGATVRGLHLTGSGSSHDRLDAGVQLRGDDNIVEDNRIEDCLFGVDVQQANGNVIRRNEISSKPFELGMRGDSVRLWYARENRIEDNRIRGVRDMVVWYSADNVIARNDVRGGRYALHFMYSKRNQVFENKYIENTVGVFLMYSDGVVLKRNTIMNSNGPTGMGVGFKESSGVRLEENVIVNCATGIYLDISPYDTELTNEFLRNQLTYNGIGVVFHSDWTGNEFIENSFVGNHVQVAVRGGGTATRQVWRSNRWDDYQGFDRNRDAQGDTPYEIYAYADQIWMGVPRAAFFRGSPLFETIQFLDRLAPFSLPKLVLRDESPRLSFPEEGAD